MTQRRNVGMFEISFPTMADPSDKNDNDRVSDNLDDNSGNCSVNEGSSDVASTHNVPSTSRRLEESPSTENHPRSSPQFSGGASGSGHKRKDTNPYSFKHFLITGGKQSEKPQHYSNIRSNSEPSEMNPSDISSSNFSSSRSNRSLILNNPELASGLPDFVQDHLIIEQCYLESNSSNPQNTSFNLEDSHIYQLETAILNSSMSSDERYSNSDDRSALANDIPFDLTSTMPNERRDREPSPLVPLAPLDLPSFHPANHRQGRPRDPPLDLPASSSSVNSSEVGTSKSLPDFLSDGPIHQRRNDELTDNNDAGLSYAPHDLSPVDRRISTSQLLTENSMLRREVESLSSMLEESNDRIERSERRNRIIIDNLEKEVNSTADTLRRTTERAAVAEATISQMKQDMESLKVQLHNLQKDEQSNANCDRKGDGDKISSTNSEECNQRLAADIQNVASSAEASLRQLLNNVETLRTIASCLGNSDKAQENEGNSLKDLNDDQKS